MDIPPPEQRRVKITAEVQSAFQPKLQHLAASRPFTRQLDVVFPSSDALESALSTLNAGYSTAQVKLADVVDSTGAFADFFLQPGRCATLSCFTMLSVDAHGDDVWCIDPRGILTLLVSKETYERLGLLGKKLPFKAHSEYFVIRLPLQKNLESTTNRARRNEALKAWDARREKEGLGAWNVLYASNDPSVLPEPAVIDTRVREAQCQMTKTSDVLVPSPSLRRHPSTSRSATATLPGSSRSPGSRAGEHAQGPDEGEDLEDWNIDVAGLFEWIGMASLGAQRKLVMKQALCGAFSGESDASRFSATWDDHMTAPPHRLDWDAQGGASIHVVDDLMDPSSAPKPDPLPSQSTPALISPVPVLTHQTSSSELNPWSDVVDSERELKAPLKSADEDISLKTPDPSVLDQSIIHGLESMVPPSREPQDEKPPQVSQDLLKQFDPLASMEEEAARGAWETAESHPPPPPPRTPSPRPPALQLNDTVASPPDSLQPSTSHGSTSPFPSLVALARTFAIPSLSRPRPLSLDAAKPVPSPATLSSFASHQDTSAITPRNDVASTSKSRSEPAHTPTGSGTASPVPGAREKGEIPFDFQDFLDQMKSRSAEPVSKYLRSFLSNFAKRTFTVNDQVKIINDFLNFIAGQMRSCDVWKNASEPEFDNAMEGMEKLVMNRLYEFTFTPQVVHADPPRPITADDLERDRVLTQRIALFGWIEEKHLDIPQGEGSAGFLLFAQQELLKINHYKAPRDKLICVLNCCKVIYGLIRHLKVDEGADAFVPLLIYAVLKANPNNLLSNVEFINRFRNPAKLQSEAGYYLSSLMGAVSFIETMDHTSLSNISQEEFEKNVENAIQALPASSTSSPLLTHAPTPRLPFHSQSSSTSSSSISSHAGEESAQPLAIASPSPALTISDDAKRLLQKTGDTISKPLNAIGRIFSEALDGAENKLSYLPGPFAPYELGRERDHHRGESSSSQLGLPPIPPIPRWSYPEGSPAGIPQTPYSAGDGRYTPPIQTPYKQRVRRVPSPSPSQSYPSPGGSPGFFPEDTPSRPGGGAPFTHQPLALGPSQQRLSPRVQSLTGAGQTGESVSRTPTPNLDLAGMQRQIDAAHEHAATASRETLVQIFPGVDVEVVEWVLEANEGDLGKSIEALLEMSSGS
ncbi:hypothetical protein DXG03_007773 [Asterophora parasitica]|uniref:Uncharacterized protein n=1 Tax=Asterophora parasitica TaxID=117018 RepID=A0A9P7KFU1_9AGAR|nr:hypothetical protein DXG03_007773 [Asterophora parasitica]